MLDYRQRPPRPWWVQLGLWGLPTRAGAMVFVWLSLGLAVASAVLGFIYPLAWSGLIFLSSAFLYWVCVRWVDRNDQWG